MLKTTSPLLPSCDVESIRRPAHPLFMFNQIFPGRAETPGASAALRASDIYSKHSGLLFLY